MKKSVIFLLNGLGIERQGSYSISIDQCMPNLARTKETSFFTTAFINSVEYKTAYESFFLGDTYRKEVKYIGKSSYTFSTYTDTVNKNVHWFLMMGESFYSKPQKEEYFCDSGYYKYHEAYHLLKFPNEKQILENAYAEYLALKKEKRWGKTFY